MIRLARFVVGTLTAGGILIAGPAGPRAQQQQAPLFRSTTALVQVDAIVLDDDERFVRGLKAEDLELFEDGKKQAIEQFYLVTHDPVTRASQIAADEEGRSAEAAHRLFLIVFDEGHLSPESLMRVRKGAEAFIMAHVGPGDAGGILVNGELYQGRITTDKGALLAGVRAASPAVEHRQGLLADFREFPRIPSEHDALRISEGARELAERVARDACRLDPVLCELEGFLEGVQSKIEQKARGYIRSARRLSDRTLQTVSSLSDSLAKFPGRKTVVLLTEGFFVEDVRASVERTAARAARAGVTIYTIDGRGLVTASGVPDVLSQGMTRSTAFDTGEDGPGILTAQTGGLMIRNVDDMPRAFGTIARDTSTYYVIGYAPAKANMDGKFRKIEVKAKAGFTVRARKGYVASALPPQERLWKQ